VLVQIGIVEWGSEAAVGAGTSCRWLIVEEEEEEEEEEGSK
jgi:hypothetical protein